MGSQWLSERNNIMLLRDVMGTKYLTDEYASDLDFMVSNITNRIRSGEFYTDDIYAYKVRDAINQAVKDKQIVLDISDCRFTGAVWESMARCMRSYDCIKFIDSTDTDRDNFLKSYSSFQYEYKDWKTVRGFASKPENIESLPQWVADLDKNVVYELYDEEYVKNPCFILAINFLDPTVKMVLDNKSVLEYAKTVFGQYLVTECTEFYYIYRNHHELLEAKMENGLIHVTNIGDFDRTTFVQKFLCMPLFIGNKRVSLANASEVLKRSVRDVLTDTSSYLNERPVTIETYFPFKESYKDDN